MGVKPIRACLESEAFFVLVLPVGCRGTPRGGRVPGVWLASFKQPSAVHGGAWKNATSVGLRAPAGRFDAAKEESHDTSDGRRAVSSSPGRTVDGRWLERDARRR